MQSNKGCIRIIMFKKYAMDQKYNNGKKIEYTQNLRQTYHMTHYRN